jgi:DAK2 domain fusion protein YloV
MSAPCDGRRLLAALEASSVWLEGQRASVDALNVFPVPDGDTGTNMSMTLSAAVREAQASPAHEAGAIAERAAYGALMGARGNSGVILSQLLRGFARALHGQRALGPAELAEAFGSAAETAGRAVMKPVEGTILTVATAAAKAAEAAAARGDDVAGVLDATLEEARAAVARTPDQLPILKQAGVVDAGAQGYLLIVEGATRFLHGQSTRAEPSAATQAPLHMARVAHGDEYGYCTEFVVVGPDLNLAHIRSDIAALGNSTLVVGEEGIVRVHIHTEDPGRVLSYAAPLGQLHKIKIENMQDQHDRFVTHGEVASTGTTGATALAPPPVLPATHTAVEGRTGVVAVAPGDGLAEVFHSLGAGAVVRGGQTMNPSTEEMLAAIDGLPQDSVVLLPNNGNVLLAAGQARDLSKKRVVIVPARSVPQGMAALVAYSPEAELEANEQAMEQAATSVRTGEVTVAVRDAQLDGLAVHAGETLGLLDDRAVVVGPDRDGVTLDLMERMGAAEAELLTIYYGAEVRQQEAEALATAARGRFDGLEVEVVRGGQPHYPYIMSIE